MFGVGAGMVGAQGLIDAPSQIFSAKLAKNAQSMQRHTRNVMFKKRYQLLRKDLEAAGYNPMLALTGGASPAGSAPGATAGQVPQGRSDVSGAMRKGALMRAEVSSARNEADRSREAVNTQTAMTEATQAAAYRDWRMAELTSYQQDELVARILNERASARHHNSMASLLDAELPSAKAAEKMYEEVPALRWIREIRNSITPFGADTRRGGTGKR